ncbi:MAG: MFS transporter [Syntrophales bacterium]|jgi:MFS transporter, ACS family, hexuronate transporter
MFKGKYRWLVVIISFILFLVGYMDRVNLAICGVTVMKEFGLSPSQLGLIFSGFTIGYTMLNFPAGWIAQKMSNRVLLSGIMVLWSLATWATGMAGGFISLMLIRVLFGMFEGPMPPSCAQVVSNWMTPKEKGTATGLYASAIPIGIVVGNLVSGSLLAAYGWRWVFYIFGFGGVIIGVVVWIIVRDKPSQHPSVTPEEAAYIESHYHIPSGQAETGSTFTEMMKNPWVWVLSASWFFYIMSFWATLNWLPTYLVMARGSSILKSGFLSSVPWILGAAGMIIVGWVTDKGKGYKANWYAFCCFIAAPFMTMAVITSSLELCLLFFSVALFFIMPCLGIATVVAMNLFHQNDAGKAHGVALTFSSAGGILAPYIVGYIVEQTHSFNLAYYIFSICSIIGGLCAVALHMRERQLRKERSGATVSAAVGVKPA